ncbi:MAG: ATP phosphoribosyltransferase [Anaerolineae bacterium]|nr:ATP phosphoribosyltransferase [Anaerolineae bacterium]MCO5206255.1 ATP phosphoribosyltransferase [Anaerolineae bacterium]
MERTDIRLALPSKGRLSEEALAFLEACGLAVYRPNPRQYIASIPTLPHVTAIFQRPGDIAVGVQQGSLDFGIVGLDIVREKTWGDDRAIVLHDELGFGACTLNVATPDELAGVSTVDELREFAARLSAENGTMLRVATKFPRLTADFLDRHAIRPYKLITAEGTLEIAPTIGYADVIVDLVSSGMTLRDNHLHPLQGGQILTSQSVLIANRHALHSRPYVLDTARTLLEYFEAHLRAKSCFTVVANVRGDSAESVADKLFDQPALGGLQGPTISNVYPSHNTATNWFAVHIVVKKNDLKDAIAALRAVGGSGVIVTPVTYIFEEEPARYTAMLAALEVT